MKCPIPGCEKSHKNQIEHYADMSGPVTTLKKVVPSISNNVSNKPKEVIPVSNGVSNRVKDWRDKNREKYNAGQRELMRERRRKAKYDSEEEGT